MTFREIDLALQCINERVSNDVRLQAKLHGFNVKGMQSRKKKPAGEQLDDKTKRAAMVAMEQMIRSKRRG